MQTFTIPLLATTRRDGVLCVLVGTNLREYPPFANLSESDRGSFLLTMLDCARDGGRSPYVPGVHSVFRDAGLILVSDDDGPSPAAPSTRARKFRLAGDELRGTPRNEHAVVMFTFPCDGMPGEVKVYSDFVDEVAKLFPTIDVSHEINKALAWVLASPERRKTARGMRSFLTRWFDRAHNDRWRKAA